MVLNSGIQRDGEAEHGRVSAFLRRAFRERELMLRSEGRVSYMRLTPRVQVLATGVCVSVFVWAAAVTGGAFWQNAVIDGKNREISEAKLAFEQLRDDLGAYQANVAMAAAALTERAGRSSNGPLISARELQDFRNQLGVIDDLNIKLAGIVEQIQVDAETPGAERGRIIASRQVLHDRIDLLRSTLSETRERETELAVTVTKLSASVESIRARENKVNLERDRLEARLAELDTQLLESRTRVGDLSRSLRETRTALRQTEQGHGEVLEQRQTLASRVEVLEEALSQARERGDGLAVEVASLERNLSQVQEARDEAFSAKNEAADALARVDTQLAVTRNRQAETESRLSELLSQAKAVERDGGATVVLAAGPRDTVSSLELAVEDLIDAVDGAQEKRKAAERTLGDVVADLRTVAGVEPGVDAADPVTSARALLASIKGLHETQELVVASLIDRTSRQIDEVQRMFDMAGLKQEHLQALGLPPERSGQGGPFHAADETGGTANGLEANIALLNDKAEKWENLENILACTPWISPVDNYHFTSGFGKRRDPINGRMAMHKGVDLAGWPKTPVYATAPGVVTKAGRDGRYGKIVEIDHGCGVVTRYAHLHKVLVKKGEEVSHRHKVGQLGNTGRSTGPHVHYEILIDGEHVDPAKFFEAGRRIFKG